MALVLTCNVGDRIEVGEIVEFEVEKIFADDGGFVLSCDDEALDVRSGRAIEVYGDVWVSAGEGWTPTRVKVVVEAPRSIRVRRVT